jgi:hypothetical protein
VGVVAAGVAISMAWGFVALGLGRRYEALRGGTVRDPAMAPAE